MQVVLEGKQEGKSLRYTYFLLDEYDAETRTSSMARTTGYTCTIIARQVLRGMIEQTGVIPPEIVGQNRSCYTDLMAGYKKRKIHLEEAIASVETSREYV